MRLMINGRDITRFLVSRNISMTMDARQNIAYDKINLTALGIDEFRPATGNTLMHATKSNSVSIYDDKDDFLIAGNMVVTGFNRDSGTSELEILPDILAVLDATPTYFAQINGITPAYVLYQLFEAVGRPDLIDIADVTRVSAILRARGVAAGLEMNLVDEENNRDKVKISEVIDEMAELFFINCWIEKGIFRMRVVDDVSQAVVPIREAHIIGWSESRDESEIRNMWRVAVGDVDYTSIDVEPTLGEISRGIYGERPIELRETHWVVSGEDGLPRGTWLDYAVEKARNKILQSDMPALYLTVDVMRAMVGEYSLGMRVAFRGVLGEIMQIATTEDSATMMIRKADG